MINSLLYALIHVQRDKKEHEYSPASTFMKVIAGLSESCLLRSTSKWRKTGPSAGFKEDGASCEISEFMSPFLDKTN